MHLKAYKTLHSILESSEMEFNKVLTSENVLLSDEQQVVYVVS